MGWYDRLSTWLDHLIEKQWHLHDVFERYFHAYGLHGPYTRHLAKTRILPAVLIGLTLLLTLAVVLSTRRLRARRRRRQLAAAAVLAGLQPDLTARPRQGLRQSGPG